ncbi:MAG: hypothetical protein Tsb0034_27750 [Ekhidna sp.]
MKSAKLHLALLSTVALTVGLGWVYQQASGTLCYAKLGFVYLGNIIFWLAAIKPVSNLFGRQLERQNIWHSLVKVGLVTLLFNQLIVYFFIEGLFSLLFSCESHILFSELILTNGLLSNSIAFVLIIIGTNYDEVIGKFKQSATVNSTKSNLLYIKQNGTIHLIQPSEIVKLEADNNAVNIYTKDKRFVQYGRLKDWEERLKSNGLVRVHRSYIINKAYIQTYQTKPSGDGLITLFNGEKVKVSRSYRPNLYCNGQLIAS